MIRVRLGIMSGHRIMINLAVAVFAMLEAVSVPLVYLGWIVPQRLIARSGRWVPVPCTVIATEGGSDDGYKHVFEYDVGAKTYRSTRATFWGDRADFRYLDGSRVMGLVDPALPEEAVLRPNWRPPGFTMIALIAWPVIATWGLVAYLAVRLNVLPIAMEAGSERKSYYREM